MSAIESNGASAPGIVATFALTLLLAGCGGGGGAPVNLVPDDDDPPEAPAPDPVVAISGSVGDGPVGGATVTARDANDEEVGTATSDPITARYDIEIPADTIYPVTLVATGGTDMVSGETPDIELLTTLASPGQTTANLSPFTTLATAILDCADGVVSEAELLFRLENIMAAIGFGLDADDVTTIYSGEIAAADMARVLLATEALAETIRRATDALTLANNAVNTTAAVTEHLACDLVDGALDGQGTDVDPDVSAAVVLASTATLGEILAGDLQVGGTSAEAGLASALESVAPTATQGFDDLPLPPALVAQFTRGLVALSTARGSTALADLAEAVEALPDGPDRDTAAAAVGADITAAMLNDSLLDATATGGDVLDRIIDGAGGFSDDAVTIDQLEAESTSVDLNASTTVAFSATNADFCVFDGDVATTTDGPTGEISTGPVSKVDFATRVTCFGAGLPTSRELEIGLNPVTVDLQSLTAEVNFGEDATLSWTTTNATRCTASGAWTGAREVASVPGGESATVDSASQTFVLTCDGPAGTAMDDVTVSIFAPTVSLTAEPATAAFNGASTLTWETTNATACTASDGWSGAQSIANEGPANAVISDIVEIRDYTLTCTGPGGTAFDTVEISLPITFDLDVESTLVGFGGNAALDWVSTNTTGCIAAEGWSGPQLVAGTAAVGPVIEQTTFELTCSNASESGTLSVEVDVASLAVGWLQQAQRADASPASLVRGFLFEYGAVSGVYDEAVYLEGSGRNELTLAAVAPGPLFFRVRAVNSDGTLGAPSVEGQVTVPGL